MFCVFVRSVIFFTDISLCACNGRAETKSYKVSPEKKQKTETPIVLRRSLRTRGMPPDSSTDETPKSSPKEDLESILKEEPFSGPISMASACRTVGSDKKLLEIILSSSRNAKRSMSDDAICDSNNGILGNEDFVSSKGGKIGRLVDIKGLKLEQRNVARVVHGRIFTVRFFPARDTRVVVVGNKKGDIGFWNIDAEDEDGDGIHVYHPHSAPVSGILFDSFSLSKVNELLYFCIHIIYELSMEIKAYYGI